MRLDPIYLVGPTPAAPSVPTRRAFLLAGGTFAVGVSLGGACGYAIGASAAKAQAPGPTAPEAAGGEDLEPSGDVELDEMRRLAVKAPIEELSKYRVEFIREFSRRYRNDEILWRGVARLCDEVISRTDYPNRTVAAVVLAQTIELGEPGLKKLLGSKISVLRSLR